MNNVEKTVSAICSRECTWSCYKKDCPRGGWHIPEHPIGPFDTPTEPQCPLMQFNAEQLPKFEGFPFEDPDRITEAKTWAVCRKCSYGGTKENMDQNLIEHCLKCTCFTVREGIQEQEAEARCS